MQKSRRWSKGDLSWRCRARRPVFALEGHVKALRMLDYIIIGLADLLRTCWIRLQEELTSCTKASQNRVVDLVNGL
ncbi:proline-, glutamic acid- and leucine-rich protein 1 [Cryptococcus neoformans Tu401-1]|nr:proline-, glutamic acid- and leucine-rich protein 1 [Cryptococcus neoformans var. grubii Tu401-1]OXM81417.1 proline-, glutamic acid- and leucine-rich protein 1 [Cryptococcus neoformans var. grubii Bt63]